MEDVKLSKLLIGLDQNQTFQAGQVLLWSETDIPESSEDRNSDLSYSWTVDYRIYDVMDIRGFI